MVGDDFLKIFYFFLLTSLWYALLDIFIIYIYNDANGYTTIIWYERIYNE